MSRHYWTCAEHCRLKRVYASATKAELCVLFPNVSARAIQQRARKLGLRKLRPPLVRSQHPLIDAVRDRARSLNYSMHDLDQLTGETSYWHKGTWQQLKTNYVNYNRINRAIEALDGKLIPVFNQE